MRAKRKDDGIQTLKGEETFVKRDDGNVMQGDEGITLPGTWPTISSANFCHCFTFSASASGLSLKSAVEAISSLTRSGTFDLLID